MKLAPLLILCLLLAATASAANWQCRNDLEIRCGSGNCQAETGDAFTPMSVSFDDAGRMSVCAYSGCWEGTGKVLQNENFMSVTGHKLKFSTGDSTESIAILFDRNDDVALLKVGEFAQPLVCGKAAAADDGEAKFIPRGWKLEDRVTGDLNGDGLADTVLQIIKDNAEDEDYNRSLIILFKTADGGFTKAAEAKKIIRCSVCGGMLGGGPADAKIENGVLILSQMYGSREASDYLQRFRYEPSSGKFRLIGEDITNYDRATGQSETTSTNYLTGKQIISKVVVNEKTGKETASKQTKTAKTALKYIEDIDYNNY